MRSMRSTLNAIWFSWCISLMQIRRQHSIWQPTCTWCEHCGNRTGAGVGRGNDYVIWTVLHGVRFCCYRPWNVDITSMAYTCLTLCPLFMVFSVVASSIHPISKMEMMISKDRETKIGMWLYWLSIWHTSGEQSSHYRVIPEPVCTRQGVWKGVTLFMSHCLYLRQTSNTKSRMI